jgi:hypothetical protein
MNSRAGGDAADRCQLTIHTAKTQGAAEGEVEVERPGSESGPGAGARQVEGATLAEPQQIGDRAEDSPQLSAESDALEAYPAMRDLIAAGPGMVAQWSAGGDEDDDLVAWPGPDGQPFTFRRCGARGGRS